MHCPKNETQKTANLVTFTEETFNEKLHFLSSDAIVVILLFL